MNLLESILGAAGGGAVGQIAKQFGIGEGQASDVIGQLAPALARGLQNNTKQSGGLDSLLSALQKGGHEKYIDNPEALTEQSTIDDGNSILGHILGSKDVSRNVAAHASKQTGISDSIIKKMLPMVASLAMGALSKQTSQTNLDQQSSGGGIGDLLGSFLDSDKDGSVVDDLIGMAGKLFSR